MACQFYTPSCTDAKKFSSTTTIAKTSSSIARFLISSGSDGFQALLIVPLHSLQKKLDQPPYEVGLVSIAFIPFMSLLDTSNSAPSLPQLPNPPKVEAAHHDNSLIPVAIAAFVAGGSTSAGVAMISV